MAKKSTDIVPADQIEAIESIAQECNLLALSDAGRFSKAITLANGIKRLQLALTGEVMAQIMPLQGNTLGFRTDRDSKGGYKIEQVRDCLIEAVLRGANPVGNEFNIIASRSYMTKEFFTRMVGEFPGLTDLKLRPGIPSIQGKSALVPYVVTWKLDGVLKKIERVKTEDDDTRIPVRVNEGQGPDAVIGKATRKILAQIYTELTGSAASFPDGEADEGEIIDVTAVSTESVKDRVRAANQANASAPEPEPDESTSEDETPAEDQETAEDLPDKTDDIPPHDEDGVVTEEKPDAEDGFQLTDEQRSKVQPTKPKGRGPHEYYDGLVELGVGVPDEMWFEVTSAELDELGYKSIDTVPQSLRMTFLGMLTKSIKAAMGD